MAEQMNASGGPDHPGASLPERVSGNRLALRRFRFARKMVVPGEGGKIAHAELTLATA